MSAFFIYLFKVCCWTAIGWFIYHFFFRKETFYAFNRLYLMTILAASFLIPLLTVHYPVEILINPTSIPSLAENTQVSRHPVDSYSMLFYLYILGGAFFLFRQLFLLLKILIRIQSSGYTIDQDCRLVDSPDTKIPFSFYHYIFLNFRQIPERERQFILAHERSHIKQRHWIDLAVAESICIFLWFNPFVWLYQRSIKENHEYLADKAVISSGYSSILYRVALINQSLNHPVFSFVNSFTSYKFKRIFMMKKETSNPFKKLAALLLIPAAGFFLWAFAEPEYQAASTKALQQTSMADLPENDSVPVETSKLDPLYIVDGEETSAASIKELDPEQIESVSVMKGETATSVYGEKGKNGAVIITTKNANQSSPLIIIDGKESSVSIQELDPEQIESIDIWKGEAATSLYGEKGKNGVILITTKK